MSCTPQHQDITKCFVTALLFGCLTVLLVKIVQGSDTAPQQGIALFLTIISGVITLYGAVRSVAELRAIRIEDKDANP